MSLSRVELSNGTVLMDISEDSVSSDKLLAGETAHGSDGEPVIGNIQRHGTVEVDVELGQAEMLDAGYYDSIQVTAHYPGYYHKVLPYDGSDDGELAVTAIEVLPGQIVTITYLLTSPNGYAYDARLCGGSYELSNNPTGQIFSNTLNITQQGILVISGYSGKDSFRDGKLATNRTDRLVGNYYEVSIDSRAIDPPSGTLTITEPGIYNVAQYAFVDVQIQ